MIDRLQRSLQRKALLRFMIFPASAYAIAAFLTAMAPVLFPILIRTWWGFLCSVALLGLLIAPVWILATTLGCVQWVWFGVFRPSSWRKVAARGRGLWMLPATFSVALGVAFALFQGSLVVLDFLPPSVCLVSSLCMSFLVVLSVFELSKRLGGFPPSELVWRKFCRCSGPGGRTQDCPLHSPAAV